MKKLLFLFISLLFVSSGYCQGIFGEKADVYIQKQAPAGKKGFVVKGSIANVPDGSPVWLQYDMTWPSQKGDSSVIRNGKFELTGYVDYPILVKVVIDPTKGMNEEKLLATAFYLENSEITYTGDANTLETYYYFPDLKGKVQAVIEGSKEDILYRQFNQELKPLNARRSALMDEYNKVYLDEAIDHQHFDNVEAAFPVVRQIKENEDAMRALRLKYVRQYPASGVANEQMEWLFRSTFYIDFTTKQIDQIMDIMKKANPGRAANLDELAKAAKQIALGAKCPDMELETMDGKKVRVWDFLPKGKYVLLDFWFPGCGPCEGEVPHLKNVYQQYKDKGFEILGLAVTPDREDWLKTISKQQMPWAQLRDGHIDDRGVSHISEVYHVTGFPTLILLDKEGHILKTDMRGANLDMALRELLGDPAK